MDTHENIRILREQQGLSQEALAEKVGYKDRSSIAKIEAGLVDLSQSKIAAFAKALNVTPTQLMGMKAPLPLAKTEDSLRFVLERYGVGVEKIDGNYSIVADGWFGAQLVSPNELLAKASEASGKTVNELIKETALIAKLPEKEVRSALSTYCFKTTTLDSASHAFTPPEVKMIKKYRALDGHGKEMVDVVLEKESARMEEESIRRAKELEQKAAAPLPLPKAKRRRDGFIEIRVYDQPAAAGLGNYLDEPDYHIEQYPADIVPDQVDFGILISGDSMEPKIHDKATAFVQACVSIDPCQIGIFILNATAYCKKLSINRETRQVRLVSVNEAYEDIIIQESDDFRTVGLVLGQWLPKQYR